MSGAVLAGGYSRRMGEDKALLRMNGTPLWRRQAAVLRAAGAAPVGVVRRRDQSRLGPRCWRDRRAGCGPLAGIETALLQTKRTHVAILAVDLPFVTAAWFRHLVAQCGPTTGAVARRVGRFEPLLAVYPRTALPEIARRLDEGKLRLQDLIAALIASRQMTPVRIPATFLPGCENLNTLPQWRSITRPSPSKPKARASTK